MSVVGAMHGKMVFGRRVRVLDVGCGDGSIAKKLMETRPDLTIEGIDVLVRPETHIPITEFDGKTIPFADGAFDVVMFVDVLHHTDDPSVLLREARRVARRAVVLKDHCRDGVLANSTLRFMDWVGNAHHGVVLPYNYWPEQRWRDAFRSIGLSAEEWRPRLHLYRFPFSLVFDRKLHFVARLTAA